MSVAAIDHAPSRRSTVERFFEALEARDYAALKQVLAPGAITRWPQSGEQVTGALSCIRVYEDYPGGPPANRLVRVTGDGSTCVAELVAQYGPETWYVASIFEFEGELITGITDYFGPTLPAPEWRRDLVDPA